MRRSLHRGLHQILPVSLALLLAVSCGTQNKNGDAAVDDLQILPGHFAEEPVTKPLVAIEAFIGANEFFVSYEGEDGLVYSGGNWPSRSRSGGQIT
jgi:hypothetical protein